MRISEREKSVIIDAVVSVDPDAKIWLFGSRVDDGKKGGDIDVGILSSRVGVTEEIGITQRIHDELGERRIDMVISKDGSDAFFKFAVIAKGIPLNG